MTPTGDHPPGESLSEQSTDAPSDIHRPRLYTGPYQPEIHETAVTGIIVAAAEYEAAQGRPPWPIRQLDRQAAVEWLEARQSISRHVAASPGTATTETVAGEQCEGGETPDTVVGYACLYHIREDDPAREGWETGTGRPVEELAALGGLIVHPDHRRQGAATLLTRARLAVTRAAGYTPVTATRGADTGYAALYPRLGAEKIGEATSGEGEPVSLWAWAS